MIVSCSTVLIYPTSTKIIPSSIFIFIPAIGGGVTLLKKRSGHKSWLHDLLYYRRWCGGGKGYFKRPKGTLCYTGEAQAIKGSFNRTKKGGICHHNAQQLYYGLHDIVFYDMDGEVCGKLIRQDLVGTVYVCKDLVEAEDAIEGEPVTRPLGNLSGVPRRDDPLSLFREVDA